MRKRVGVLEDELAAVRRLARTASADADYVHGELVSLRNRFNGKRSRGTLALVPSRDAEEDEDEDDDALLPSQRIGRFLTDSEDDDDGEAEGEGEGAFSGEDEARPRRRRTRRSLDDEAEEAAEGE